VEEEKICNIHLEKQVYLGFSLSPKKEEEEEAAARQVQPAAGQESCATGVKKEK